VDSWTLAHKTAQILAKYDGQEVVIIDCRENNNGLFDFMVITHTDNDRHIKALVEHVEEDLLKDCNVKPWHVVGLETRNWVAMDYIDVIVHIMKKEIREYYRIEDMWDKESIIKI